MSTPVVTVYYGSLINPTTLTTYEATANCLIAVNAQGNIDWIVHDVKDSSVQETLLQKGLLDTDVAIVELREGQFIMPGFVDTHTVCDVYFSGSLDRTDPRISMLLKYPILER